MGLMLSNAKNEMKRKHTLTRNTAYRTLALVEFRTVKPLRTLAMAIRWSCWNRLSYNSHLNCPWIVSLCDRREGPIPTPGFLVVHVLFGAPTLSPPFDKAFVPRHYHARQLLFFIARGPEQFSRPEPISSIVTQKIKACPAHQSLMCWKERGPSGLNLTSSRESEEACFMFQGSGISTSSRARCG